jgi:uncharacterized membrane protein YtjA (UPF0391 family)
LAQQLHLHSPEGETAMLRLALLFLVIALVAGFFGFGLVANLAFEAARLLFFVFIVLAAFFILAHVFRGSTPRDLY